MLAASKWCAERLGNEKGRRRGERRPYIRPIYVSDSFGDWGGRCSYRLGRNLVASSLFQQSGCEISFNSAPAAAGALYLSAAHLSAPRKEHWQSVEVLSATPSTLCVME
jgi:hypothetical protein